MSLNILGCIAIRKAFEFKTAIRYLETVQLPVA